jgi:vacuolar-type H+-ATPase subunit I/STV1
VPIGRGQGAKNIRARQTALDKAYQSVGGYMNTLNDKLGEPGYSNEIVERVVAWHRETLKNTKDRLERAASVVEKSIEANRAQLSRNKKRS